MMNSSLLDNIDKIHTTPLGIIRIKRNLNLQVSDELVVRWCAELILDSTAKIIRRGKNWYIIVNDCEITVNAHSYTIITAHKV